MVERPKFTHADVEIMEREPVYEGFFRMIKYRVRHRLFGGGWSNPASRELFERGPAVGVLPYDPATDRVALIEQFRIGALENPETPWLYEVVAGVVEEDESAGDVAAREMDEEAGIRGARLIPLADYLVSPGGTNERMILYCGLVDLPEQGGGVHGRDDEGEDIRLHVFDRTEALEALERGLCNNAPLTIALQWLALHHRRLRNEFG